MGYMGLSCVCDSDGASDLLYFARKSYLDILNEGMKIKENGYNTDGDINVGLIIEDGDLDNYPDYMLKDLDFKYLLDSLSNKVKISSADRAEEWDDEDNRLFHYEAYKRILDNVKAFLKKKEMNI